MKTNRIFYGRDNDKLKLIVYILPNQYNDLIRIAATEGKTLSGITREAIGCYLNYKNKEDKDGDK
jgi:hypothetical protein